MNKLGNIGVFGLIRILISYVFFYASLCVPRSRKIWIFIGWRRIKEREIFAENTKYFFLHANNNLKPDIRPIWIGMDAKICALLKKRGYEAYPINSVLGIWFSLRAGYTFLGGLFQPQNWRLSGRTKIIQLWHGKSVKKTGYNSPYGLSRYKKFLQPNLFAPYHKFVAISDFLSDFIVTDFHVPKKDILVTGIPKHDVMVSEIAGSDIDLDTDLETLIQNIRNNIRPRRLYLYGPTFRPDGSNPLSSVNFEELNSALKNSGDAVIVSLHPKFSTKDWVPDTSTLTNVFFIASTMDIYPLIPKLDALITDYSSLIVDFIYLKKPSIIYAPDFASYDKGMGVYEDLWTTMPGPKVFTFTELLGALQHDFESAEHKKSIGDAHAKLFSFNDGNASERIAKAILKN